MKYLNDGNNLRQTETQRCHVGRNPRKHAGLVNVPIYRGSTILSDTLEEWEERRRNPITSYGRFGSPLSRALETAACELEGGYRSILFPSGLSSCTRSLLGVLKAGDHLLISDSVYPPMRTFAEQVFARLQIEVQYFRPTQGSELSAKIKANTRVIYLESPGSMTFEVQDVPALAAIAHQSDALVIMDNTWATPLYFKPFEHGVDISIHSATKYIVGHSPPDQSKGRPRLDPASQCRVLSLADVSDLNSDRFTSARLRSTTSLQRPASTSIAPNAEIHGLLLCAVCRKYERRVGSNLAPRVGTT
ncbi:trans-sulfuration enzyme family protein [Bradyrhizobium sp. BWA-3-5]|uniref:trans-sulfuration enzyme family protein n=1 Tax=Bradyrhizobium sp. BWA-3-5 TaxID=3080013 RepID=UPI00293E39C2|nr:aminotransferase class V-fold PLP-dependent enzyme [Bradyrhizobium sp. BWA-3-5]WOH63843.1 aminotransferase class V-fold PLP-dependent enzyme [Bradyrhizobium sp. BWA-3-5]